MALGRVPQAELEAFAHEQYVRKYANVPAPKLVNIEALVVFTEDREATWAGVVCRAPPLAFRLGVRLMVASNALRDLRVAGAPALVRADAVRTTAPFVFAAMRPIRAWRRGLRFSRRLHRLSPEEMEAACFWLLHVPDNSVSPPPSRPVTIDLMDSLAGFAREFQTWCHDAASAREAGPWHVAGLPRSWAHYQYALRHAGRASHREDLRHGIAVRAAQSDHKGWKVFEEEWRPAAGWMN